MERIVMQTADGSPTITIPAMGVSYHSRYGAVQESMHVFIAAGYQQFTGKPAGINMLEMGFGTGLNALLTLGQAVATGKPTYYHALELYPLQSEEYADLGYAGLAGTGAPGIDLQDLHKAAWETDVPVTPHFTLHKSRVSVLGFSPLRQYDLVYYDAFAPGAQPELWTVDVFSRLFTMMAGGGRLVTYCSKGDVRRAMLAAGFIVEKLPGPKGKREMLRAIKP